MSDRRAKRGEIWDSRVVVQHIMDTFGLFVFNVILRPFGALPIFRNLGLMLRDRRKNILVTITPKRWEIDMRLLYISIGNHIWRVPWHHHIWPWVSKSRSLRFRSFVSCKGAELGHMLLLNINRKAYMWSLLVWLYLTPVTFKGQGLTWKVNVRVTQILKAYIS